MQNRRGTVYTPPTPEAPIAWERQFVYYCPDCFTPAPGAKIGETLRPRYTGDGDVSEPLLCADCGTLLPEVLTRAGEDYVRGYADGAAERGDYENPLVRAFEATYPYLFT